MAFSSGSSRHAAINVTPLIDVLLVLLIIFMVIVPTRPRGLSSALPQPPTEHTFAPPEAPLVLELTGSSTIPARFRVGGAEGSLAELGPRLTGALGSRSDRTVFLRGVPTLEFSSVAQAIAAVHAAGGTEVAILTPGLEQRI